MYPHPHFDRFRIPAFSVQGDLRLYSRMDSLTDRMKGNAEGVTDDLEDIPVMRFHGNL
jgi:hypothetical protein